MKTKWLHFTLINVFFFLSVAGYSQCLNTNGNFSAFTGPTYTGPSGQQLNTWINTNLTNWKVSHGTPSYNSNTSQIWMWSYDRQNDNIPDGEGVYTDYNFVLGTSYRITYDILRDPTSNQNSKFRVFVANTLTPLITTSFSSEFIPNLATSSFQQLPDLPWSTTGTWTTITETFVANNNYDQLWLHPYLNETVNQNTAWQAACTIDNICVEIIPTVVATEPNVSLCCEDGPITIGAEWIPTGNIYWTNDYFTPVHGYPGGIGAQIGGQFTNLPSCGITTEVINDFRVYKFDPCLCGPDIYPIEYTFTDSITGLSNSAIMNITVGGPSVAFAPLTIDLCSYSGPVQINPLHSGVGCTVISPYMNQQNEFDAIQAGVGTHTVQITCEDQMGCSTTITGTIIVEQNDGWHNTTSNAIALGDQGDSGNDIYTDKEGYVYSTGSFYQETTFNDTFGNSINLVTTTPKEEKFYAVCYNECGELQWVVYDEFQASNHNSEGFGIVKNGDEIFVGVNYTPKAVFKTVYPNMASFVFGTNASGSNAVIGNVCLLAIDGPNTSTFGRVNAIDNTLTQRNGKALYSRPTGPKNVYVCGSSDLNNNFVPEVFFSMAKYSPSGNFFSSLWSRESLDESTYHVANDIVYDPGSELIMITGSYASDFSLLNSPGNAIGFSSPANKDAFFTTVDLNGYVSGFGLRQFGVNAGEESEGTTITNNTDYFYIGGNYRGEAASPFSFGLGSAISSLNSSYTNGFVFSYKRSGGTPKFEDIWNTNSPVTITGIDALLTNVALVGYYGNGTAQSSLGSIGNNTITDNQIFVGRINIAAGNWYAPQLVNTTLHLNDGNHRSTRVSVGDNGYSFITGEYKGRLSYLFGSPNSGDLGATGSSQFVYNAFFMRHELDTNQLRSTENDEEDVAQEQERNVSEEVLSEIDAIDQFSVKAYPNPTRDILTVAIDNYKGKDIIDVKVFDVLGKLIYTSKASESQFEIDTSSFENGIYFLKINSKDKTEVLRIIKA